MRKSTLILFITFGTVMLAVLLLSASARAQGAARGGSEVDSLVDRIKAARERDERLYGEGEPTPYKPVLRKETPAEQGATQEGTPNRSRAPVTVDESGNVQRGREYLNGATDTSASELVERIKASRSEEAEKAKAEREKAAAESVAPESVATPPPTPGTDISKFQRFLTPGSREALSGTVGGEALQDRSRYRAMAAARRAAESGAVPDPTQNAEAYDEVMRSEQGTRGELPAYADKNLLGVYETDRYGRWLSQNRDTHLEPGRVGASQAYQTYQDFSRSADIGSIIGRRDVYVTNATNFVNPTYRGSVYETPYSSDPYRRSASMFSTQSKYSSAGYYNLGTRESYEDYYTREYGVSRDFVPGTLSSRQYEVNTVKQWSDQIRQNYGVDVRPGEATYGDLYRLNTGLRKR